MCWLGALLGAGACAPYSLPAPCDGAPDDTCVPDALDVDGVERTFIVGHQSAHDCDGGALPLVLAWHGSGSNGQELRSILGVEEAFGGNAFFVYPNGLARDELGGRTGWDRSIDGQDVAFFDALIAHFADGAATDDAGPASCVDTSRVFSVGHSRGGRFVDTLGCVRGDRHVAMASIAAGANNVDASQCTTSVPVWLTHGIHDQQVSFDEGLQLRDAWAARNGCDDPQPPIPGSNNACVTLAGCDEPVVFCPSTVEEWDGHFPPSFADERIAAFFRARD